MKRKLPIILLTAAVVMILATLAYAGNSENNGGAGIYRNGQYMTFYTAGLYVEPQSGAPFQMPTLTYLERYISWMPYISTSTRSDLLAAVTPSPLHRYYIVSADHFSPKTYDRLKAEYHRVTGVPLGDLQLFAITDINSRNTYILPEFFKLNAYDQTAVLFHESYWLMHPNATYNDVVSAEMAFEAILKRPQDRNRIWDFLSRVGTTGDKLLYAVNTDRATGVLNGFLKNGDEMTPNMLLGDAFIRCNGATDNSDIYGIPRDNPGCMKYFYSHVFALQSRYPKSIFMRLLVSQISNKKLVMSDFFDAVRTDSSSNFPPIYRSIKDCVILFRAQSIEGQTEGSAGLALKCNLTGFYEQVSSCRSEFPGDLILVE